MSTVLWLFYDFLFGNNDVYDLQKVISEKTDEKSRIQSRIWIP